MGAILGRLRATGSEIESAHESRSTENRNLWVERVVPSSVALVPSHSFSLLVADLSTQTPLPFNVLLRTLSLVIDEINQLKASLQDQMKCTDSILLELGDCSAENPNSDKRKRMIEKKERLTKGNDRFID